MVSLKHVVALLVLVAGIFFVVNMKKDDPTPPVVIPEESASTIPTSGTQCFYRKDEATPSAPYSVEEHIVLYFNDYKISGTKRGIQAGPDMTNGYEGTLMGAVIEKDVELIYEYTIEGSQNRELEVYAFDEGLSRLGSGKADKLIKKRWALKEEKINRMDILVPDYVGEPTLIPYQSEPCL